MNNEEVHEFLTGNKGEKQMTDHRAVYNQMLAEGRNKAAEAYAKQFLNEEEVQPTEDSKIRTYSLKCKVSGCTWEHKITSEDKEAAKEHLDRGSRCPDHYAAMLAEQNKQFEIKCGFRIYKDGKWQPCGKLVKRGTRAELKGVQARCAEHKGLVSHSAVLGLTVSQILDALSNMILSDEEKKELRKAINKKK